MQLHTYPPKYSRGSQSWKYNKTFLFFFYHNFFFFCVLSIRFSLSLSLSPALSKIPSAVGTLLRSALPVYHIGILFLLFYYSPPPFIFSPCASFLSCLFCIQSVAVSTDRRRFCLSRQTNNNFSHDPRRRETTPVGPRSNAPKHFGRQLRILNGPTHNCAAHEKKKKKRKRNARGTVPSRDERLFSGRKERKKKDGRLLLYSGWEIFFCFSPVEITPGTSTIIQDFLKIPRGCSPLSYLALSVCYICLYVSLP